MRFELKDGVWKGPANWGSYETRWELSVTAEGLVGRSEWVTVHERTILTRGWSGRTFTKLKRVHWVGEGFTPSQPYRGTCADCQGSK